jgi:transcriptional regulator with XRE-family HTH domain
MTVDAGRPDSPAVGAAIARARQRAGLSTRELAGRAGMSQPFLSNLENGRAMPSIATLYRLAHALGIEANQLLPPTDGEPIRVVRAHEGAVTPIDDRSGAGRSRLVLGGPDDHVEVHELTAEAGQHLGDWFDHDGEDVVVLLAGRLRVELGPHRHEDLEPGDVIRYPGRLPHRWSTPDGGGARILLIGLPTHQHARH